MTSNNNSTTAHSTESVSAAKTSASNDHAGSSTEENRWVLRLEELLKVKNLSDLKSELSRLASEIQSEIQNFDINAHLSPSAKSRLKSLEQSYTDVVKAVTKAQKQFDREFNNTLSVMKRTRLDAEKQLNQIRTRITKHRGTLIKASKGVKGEIKKRAKKVVTTAKKQAKARFKK